MDWLNNELQLSKESQNFLEKLNGYLFSSGKNQEEIDDIVSELEVHLLEAEKKGKPIEKVVGNSPKEYMKMISDEMIIDYKTWTKYICFIVFGSFSFSIFVDLWEGNLSYSVLDIIGHIIISAIFIASVFTGFKFIFTTNRSLKIQRLTLASIAILPFSLFVGLIYLNRFVDTPIIHFGNKGSLAVGVIAGLIIIGVSIWTKSWILIILMAFLILPNYLLNRTSLQAETQSIISVILTYGGIAISFWMWNKLDKSKY